VSSFCLFFILDHLSLSKLVHISDEGATQGTTSRVHSHLHELGGRLFVSSVVRRCGNVGCQVPLDVLIGTRWHKGTLRLVHQFLHNVREVAIILLTSLHEILLFLIGRFVCGCVKKVGFSNQMIPILAVEGVRLLLASWRPLHDIKRANCLVGR